MSIFLFLGLVMGAAKGSPYQYLKGECMLSEGFKGKLNTDFRIIDASDYGDCVTRCSDDEACNAFQWGLLEEDVDEETRQEALPLSAFSCVTWSSLPTTTANLPGAACYLKNADHTESTADDSSSQRPQPYYRARNPDTDPPPMNLAQMRAVEKSKKDLEVDEEKFIASEKNEL